MVAQFSICEINPIKNEDACNICLIMLSNHWD